MEALLFSWQPPVAIGAERWNQRKASGILWVGVGEGALLCHPPSHLLRSHGGNFAGHPVAKATGSSFPPVLVLPSASSKLGQPDDLELVQGVARQA